jgi:putative ubiquitin-RnfH superfamily antitoxin RatB of RatAB toxin-antitoxin module
VDAAPACLVAIDTPGGPWLCTVPLTPGLRVADALVAARGRAALAAAAGLVTLPQGWASVDWASECVGIWGQRCTRERPVQAGERVELYLPLPGDPRVRRRALSQSNRAQSNKRRSKLKGPGR